MFWQQQIVGKFLGEEFSTLLTVGTNEGLVLIYTLYLFCKDHCMSILSE